jgi:hypothetical protein
MSNVTVLSRSKVDKEASVAASLVYDGQAIVRVCMILIDDDTGPDQLDRHTIWRALSVADRTLQQAGDMTGELGLIS